MGLDLYAGALTRYHTGEWEPEAVRLREAGMAVDARYTDGLQLRSPEVRRLPFPR
jgi:hypothetical protein